MLYDSIFFSFGPIIKLTKQVQDIEIDASPSSVCEVILNYQPV